MREKTDEQLMVEFRDGNHAAFNEIYRRYRDDVEAIIVSVLRKHPNAVDDMVQDTFYRLHKYAKTYKSEKKFSHWLSTIAFNAARDYLRRQRRNKAQLSFDTRITSGTENTFLKLFVSDAEQPQEYVELKERQEVIRQGMKRLEKKYRVPLRMVYFKANSYADVAKREKLPMGTVKSRIHCGVNLLHQYCIGRV